MTAPTCFSIRTLRWKNLFEEAPRVSGGPCSSRNKVDRSEFRTRCVPQQSPPNAPSVRGVVNKYPVALYGGC